MPATHRRKEACDEFVFVLRPAGYIVPMALKADRLHTLNRTVVTVSSRSRSSQQVLAREFEPPRFTPLRPSIFAPGFRSGFEPNRAESGATRGYSASRREMRLDGRSARRRRVCSGGWKRAASLVRWRAVSDSSHMTHFLDWREAIVQWEPVDAHTTKVTWTLRYRRGLDPSWYFGPMERHAARLAAGYLIDSVATP